MAEQRLIDANNLIEEIREERCYNCRNFKDMKCDYCGTADYIYMIEDMPAADVAPVIHAHWVSASKKQGVNIGMKCSLCGARIKNSEFFNGNHNYCHKCGAQMDEKENDNATY